MSRVVKHDSFQRDSMRKPIQRDPVRYLVSLHVSDHDGYHMAGKKPYVEVFLPGAPADFDQCWHYIDDTLLLERICLERAFSYQRLKCRCQLFELDGVRYPCKTERVLIHVLYMLL